MKKHIKIILCFILLGIFVWWIEGGANSTKIEENKNSYYKEIYDIDDTNLNICRLSFEQFLKHEDIISDDKYILLVISRSCSSSNDLFNQLIKLYNSEEYNFKKIYIFEVEDYVEEDEKRTKLNRDKYLRKINNLYVPVTIFVSKKQVYNTEIGYYTEDILRNVLEEFEEK